MDTTLFLAKNTSSLIAKHNSLRDVLNSFCTDAAFMTETEIALKNDLPNEQRNRGGDLVIKCYEGGKDINIDVSVINPMAVSYVQLAREPLGAAKKRLDEKRRKYQNVIGNNWFEPMAVESFGELFQSI